MPLHSPRRPGESTGDVPSERFLPPSPDEWSQAWQEVSESPAERRAYLEGCSLFDHLLAEHLPRGEGRRALEIGCYPGGFMSRLHHLLGYSVSGLDYLPETRSLVEILSGEGVPVDDVIVGDFLTIPPRPVFDVVASFGFIEHFHDPASVIRRHAEWLAPGGSLVLEVPYFRRLQWLLHRWLDRENLRGHNTAAMSRRLIRKTCQGEGLEIVYLGWQGVCNAWFEAPESTTSRIVLRVMNSIDSALRRLPARLSNPVTSPFLVCIARRPASS